MNKVNLSGVVCSIPTERDFIIKVDDEYIHCNQESFLISKGDEVEIEGKICSFIDKIRGKNVLLYKIAPTSVKILCTPCK